MQSNTLIVIHLIENDTTLNEEIMNIVSEGLSYPLTTNLRIKNCIYKYYKNKFENKEFRYYQLNDINWNDVREQHTYP